MEATNLVFATAGLQPQPDYDEDVWDVRHWGIAAQPAAGDCHLSFTTIPQLWLRQATKQFIGYTLATLSFGSAKARLSALKKFAGFLAHSHPLLQPAAIKRPLIIEYLSYLSGCALSASFRSALISSLNSFLALSARHAWLAIPPEPLIFREDYPRLKKRCHAIFQPRSWHSCTSIWTCCHCHSNGWCWCCSKRGYASQRYVI